MCDIDIYSAFPRRPLAARAERRLHTYIDGSRCAVPVRPSIWRPPGPAARVWCARARGAGPGPALSSRPDWGGVVVSFVSPFLHTAAAASRRLCLPLFIVHYSPSTVHRPPSTVHRPPSTVQIPIHWRESMFPCRPPPKSLHYTPFYPPLRPKEIPSRITEYIW